MKAKMQENPGNPSSWIGLSFYYYGLNGSTYLSEQLDMHRYPNFEATRLETMLKKYSLEELGNAFMF